MKYRADGFKADGRRQRVEVKCTPLNQETLYLQLMAQGRDPIQETVCERNLILAGISPEEAHKVAPLIKKPKCSDEEEALVKRVWIKVRG